MLQVENPALLREEIRRLKSIIEYQDEELRFLKGEFKPGEWEPPVEISLTKHEARILACLYKNKGETVSKEHIFQACYHDILDQPEIKIVDVFVCKMRKKLRIYGIEITTVWARGYSLDSASIEILNSWGQDPTEEAIAA